MNNGFGKRRNLSAAVYGTTGDDHVRIRHRHRYSRTIRRPVTRSPPSRPFYSRDYRHGFPF